MDSNPQRPWWRIRLWKVALAGIVLLALYGGTFFALRRAMSVTFLVRQPYPLYSVRVFFFSKNRQLNYAAWLFYYPLHRQSTESLRRLDDALFVSDGDEEMARLKLRTFYVADVNMLYQAEVIGFHSKGDEQPVKTTAGEEGDIDSKGTEPKPAAPQAIADQQAAVDAPSELTLYSLDFRERRIDPIVDDDKRERFGDFLVLGKVKVEEAAKRKEIMAAIHKAIPNNSEGPACFWPRHGLKIVDSKGITEMVICFQCVQYTSTGAHAIEGYGTISPAPNPLLNKILNDAGVEIVPDDFGKD